MKLFAKVLILIFSHLITESFEYAADGNTYTITEGSNSEESIATTTKSPAIKVDEFLNSANFIVKVSPIEMCQYLHEFAELKQIGVKTEKLFCMREKLRIENSGNYVECLENPQAKNSIIKIQNRPKILALGFAYSLCDAEYFNTTISAQFDRALKIFGRIIRPQQVPCLKYMLHELNPDSPLISNYDSSEDYLLPYQCGTFFRTFQSHVIDAIIKKDEEIFGKLNISGCIKINITEHETKKAYQIGLIAAETPEDEIMDEIRRKNFEFKEMFITNMLDCYLDSIYEN